MSCCLMTISHTFEKAFSTLTALRFSSPLSKGLPPGAYVGSNSGRGNDVGSDTDNVDGDGSSNDGGSDCR